MLFGSEVIHVVETQLCNEFQGLVGGKTLPMTNPWDVCDVYGRYILPRGIYHKISTIHVGKICHSPWMIFSLKGIQFLSLGSTKD